MSGYLYFDKTGVPEIDAIGDALKVAGSGYHNTDSWGDPNDWREDKKSYLQLIQDALNNAASAMRKTPEAPIKYHPYPPPY